MKLRIIQPKIIAEAKRRALIWDEPIYIGSWGSSAACRMSYSDALYTTQKSTLARRNKPWSDPRPWVTLAVVHPDGGVFHDYRSKVSDSSGTYLYI